MSRAGFRLMREKDYSNPMEWEERLFFTQMRDSDISSMTSGQFPDSKKSYGTHPVFLLRTLELGVFEFCPCSTKGYNNDKASYIRQNSRTSPHGLRVDKNSYILHFLSFNLTSTSHLTDRMPLLGRVDENDIIGDFHIRRGAR